MGARTAVHVADDPAVVGVVGLAPWLPADEPVTALAGRHLVAAHGRRDRITSFRATAAYVERARGRWRRLRCCTTWAPVGHYLLRRVRRLERPRAGSSALAMLDVVSASRSSARVRKAAPAPTSAPP